jgi:tryptophan synthase beta chain
VIIVINLSGRGDKDMETAGAYFDLIDAGAEQS